MPGGGGGIFKLWFDRYIKKHKSRADFSFRCSLKVGHTDPRRIDKCPSPGQRFSDKFLTAGTDKITNTTTTTIMIKFINEMASTRECHFHFRKLPSVRLFCYEYFSNKRIKSRMAFQQLAGVALPYEQRLHFRCVSWRAKSFAWQLKKRKCSLCSQGGVAFAITRFITFQRLTFYNLLAYRD